MKLVQKENKLASCSCDPQSEYPTFNPEEANSVTNDGYDILVNQCESAVTMEYSGTLSDMQVIEAEAYAT